jgi:hypothetical protein
LAAARAGAGIGFTEKARSRIGQMHLQFADLYGIFQDSSAASRMLGGWLSTPWTCSDRVIQSPI